MTEPVNVTSPYLPPLEEVLPYLQEMDEPAGNGDRGERLSGAE